MVASACIAPLEGLASYLYSYSAVIIIKNMILIVKNRAGAKVLPDGLEVKDVRFEIGPTTLQFEIHVTGYVTPSLRRHKRPVGCDSQGTESRDAPVEAKAVSQSAAVGIDLDRRALALRETPVSLAHSLTRDALCSLLVRQVVCSGRCGQRIQGQRPGGSQGRFGSFGGRYSGRVDVDLQGSWSSDRVSDCVLLGVSGTAGDIRVGVSFAGVVRVSGERVGLSGFVGVVVVLSCASVVGVVWEVADADVGVRVLVFSLRQADLRDVSRASVGRLIDQIDRLIDVRPALARPDGLTHSLTHSLTRALLVRQVFACDDAVV